MSENKPIQDGVVLSLDKRTGFAPKIEPVNDFKQSLFRDCYFDVYRYTDYVIGQNDYVMQSNKEQNKSDTSSHKIDFGKEGKIYNIIPFMGNRGSGKTSVMYSFLNALQSKGDNYVKFVEEYQQYRMGKAPQQNDIGAYIKETDFVMLKPIDATISETDENIVDIVLANMYELFKSYSDNIYYEIEQYGLKSKKISDIQAKFRSVYDTAKNLNGDSDIFTSISAIDDMKRIYKSTNLRRLLSELVNMYIDFVDSGNKKRKYMVITIDDIDLSSDGGDILSDLHKYFMLPNVIIYISCDEIALKDACIRYYMLENFSKQSHYGDVYMKSQNMAQDLIDKVLPAAIRVYLPESLKRDTSIKVDSNTYDIKSTILLKILHRTGVYYDGVGKKRHFFEYENLRRLVNFYYMLDEMPKFTSEKGERDDLSFILPNSSKLRSDIRHHLAPLIIHDERYRQYFIAYCNEDITRRGKYFVDTLMSELSEGYYKQDYKRGEYTYGDLLRGIYVFGRELTSSRELIHCVIADYTIDFTNIYNKMIYGNIPNSNRYREDLRECLGGSVIGSWANRIIPYAVKKGKSYNAGYTRGGSVDRTMIWNTGIKVEQEFKSIEQIKGFLDDIKEEGLIKNLMMFLLMFSEKTNYDDRIITFSDSNPESRNISEIAEKDNVHNEAKGAKELKKQDTPNKLVVNITSGDNAFDFLGFVTNMVDYKNKIKIIEENIEGALRDFVSNLIINPNTRQNAHQRIDELINEEKVFSKELVEWGEKTDGVIIPFYSLDITYNVMKRVRNHMREKYSCEIELKKIPVVYAECYMRIIKELEKEDIFYGSEKDSEKSFAECFKNCPWVTKYLDMKDSKKEDGLFNLIVEFIEFRNDRIERSKDLESEF